MSKTVRRTTVHQNVVFEGKSKVFSFFQKFRAAENKRNVRFLYFLEVGRKAVVDLGFRALRWVTDWDDFRALFDKTKQN